MASNGLSKESRQEISKLLKEKGLLPAGTKALELTVSPEGMIGDVNIKLTVSATK